MRPDKAAAKAAGIPKAFRRYATRYGSVGTKPRDRIDALLKDHKKSPVPTLDHGRDRRIAKDLAVMGIAPPPERAPIEGVALAS